MFNRDFDFDLEGRDDIMRTESEYDAYLDAVKRIARGDEQPVRRTQEVSDMYAELDVRDCD